MIFKLHSNLNRMMGSPWKPRGLCYRGDMVSGVMGFACLRVAQSALSRSAENQPQACLRLNRLPEGERLSSAIQQSKRELRALEGVKYRYSTMLSDIHGALLSGTPADQILEDHFDALEGPDCCPVCRGSGRFREGANHRW